MLRSKQDGITPVSEPFSASRGSGNFRPAGTCSGLSFILSLTPTSNPPILDERKLLNPYSPNATYSTTLFMPYLPSADLQTIDFDGVILRGIASIAGIPPTIRV